MSDHEGQREFIGGTPRTEFCHTVAWSIAQQNLRFDNEFRAELIRTGFCSQQELGIISQLWHEYNALESEKRMQRRQIELARQAMQQELDYDA